MNDRQSEQETKPDYSVIETLKPIAYDVTEEAIAQLTVEFKDLDADTDDGFTQLKAAKRRLTSYRTAIESKRKLLRKPAQAYIDEAKSVADGIVQQLKDIEAPIDEKIAARKKKDQEAALAKKKAEDERLEKHQRGIRQIKAHGDNLHSRSAAEIKVLIDSLKAVEVTEHQFEEFAPEAQTTKSAALFELNNALESAETREENERVMKEQQEIIDRQNAEIAEAKRIQDEKDAEIQRERQEKLDAEQREKDQTEAAKRAAQEERERIEAEKKAEDERKEQQAAAEREAAEKAPDIEKLKIWRDQISDFRANPPSIKHEKLQGVLEDVDHYLAECVVAINEKVPDYA